MALVLMVAPISANTTSKQDTLGSVCEVSCTITGIAFVTQPTFRNNSFAPAFAAWSNG